MKASNKKIPYVAFLRGINVGGKHSVKMDDVKALFEDLELLAVKTLIASGNVYFETERKDEENLQSEIEAALEKKFGFAIGTIVRKIDELKALMERKPFAGIKVTPQTRLYVTFLQKKLKEPKSVEFKSPHKNFHVIEILEKEVLFYLELDADHRGTVDAMGSIEKTFGKNVTTRNWNTVLKMAAL